MNINIQSLSRAFGLALVLGIAACGSDNGMVVRAPPPDVISLPVGFRPEGIAISGTSLYAGSIPTGRVFRADITTGQGQVIVDPPAGRSAIGMKVDGRGRLFVAGGATGQAYVYGIRRHDYVVDERGPCRQ
jgi:sugar lactone lactonase YvrE